jgi:hypothetical protein
MTVPKLWHWHVWLAIVVVLLIAVVVWKLIGL